jgi:hypothetical protein
LAERRRSLDLELPTDDVVRGIGRIADVADEGGIEAAENEPDSAGAAQCVV